MAENLSQVTPRKRGLKYPGAILTKKQEIEALAKLENPLAKAFVIFVSQTGLRISEALVVTVQDIENGHAVIKGKRGRIRTIYFNPTLREQMLRYVSDRQLRKNQDPNLLFPVGRRCINYHLHRVGMYPHQLRHTFLTRTLRRTKNLKLVQELAGHKKIDTTALYLHFTEEEVRSAYEKAVSPIRRLLSYFKIEVIKKSAVVKVPDRKLSPDPYHTKFVVYGEKGVGKSYIIRNTWPEHEFIKWETKGQVSRALRLLDNPNNLLIWIDYGNQTPTKLKFAEELEQKHVAEFRILRPVDEKAITNRLFEFQPFKILPFTLPEARHYLKFLCRTSTAQYSRVKNLVDINTNPLFLRENLLRKRSEIQMSAPPVTLGFLFIILAIVFMLSRYVAMGRESYFFAMGGYFIFRIFARL